MFWTTTDGQIDNLNVRVQPGFSVDTKYAIKWIQTEDNNWHGVDRGASSDIYDTEFEVVGTQAEVEAVVSAIHDNREASGTAYEITLSGVAIDEKIFGEDVVHEGLKMQILEYGTVTQHSWKVFGSTVRARAVSASFSGTATLPAFKIMIGRVASPFISLNKVDTYSGVFYETEHNSDVGTATISVCLTLANTANLRRAIATTRAGNFTMPATSGVWNIFGSTRPAATTVKIMDMEDSGYFGLTHKITKLTLAEVA